ncbi:MAG TPA: hypothetical protein VGV61_14805 [Thermoanaerobaculia bacterium]|nr:hypothetical protein [Thermoanaerobaculia bacterium]
MTAQPTYAPPPPPALPPSMLPNWLRVAGLGCGAVLLLGSVVGTVVYAVVHLATAGPDATIKAFLTAAGNGDYDAAHAYFAEPLKQVQPLATFRSVAAANRNLFQVQDTTFNNRSVDLTGAELSGTVTLTGGTQLPATFKLVRENGQWRLISYQIGSG